MRVKTFCIFCSLLLSGSAVCVSGADAPGALPATAPASATQVSSGDVGTEAVTAFYKMLLQDTPPTVEQETALIIANEGIRPRLIAAGFGGRKDPVFLNWFRANKALFLPKNPKSLLREVNITSTFNGLRNLEYLKDPPRKGSGNVLAMFIEDRKAVSPRLHVILFRIENGKISAEAIYLNGYGEGPIVLEEWLKLPEK